MIRSDSQCGRILRVLADGKSHTVPEVHRRAGSSRLNSRIADLRRAGYVIECERVPGRKGAGAYRYRLLSHPETLAAPGPMVSLAEELNAAERLPAIDGDNHAPRRPEERFRIYRLAGDGELDLIATCESTAAVGATICTLGREGEFANAALGVLDSMAERLPNGDGWKGSWLINAYDARAAL